MVSVLHGYRVLAGILSGYAALTRPTALRSRSGSHAPAWEQVRALCVQCQYRTQSARTALPRWSAGTRRAPAGHSNNASAWEREEKKILSRRHGDTEKKEKISVSPCLCERFDSAPTLRRGSKSRRSGVAKRPGRLPRPDGIPLAPTLQRGSKRGRSASIAETGRGAPARHFHAGAWEREKKSLTQRRKDAKKERQGRIALVVLSLLIFLL